MTTGIRRPAITRGLIGAGPDPEPDVPMCRICTARIPQERIDEEVYEVRLTRLTCNDDCMGELRNEEHDEWELSRY